METLPKDISDYLRAYGTALGDRVLREFPPLHNPSDPVWPEVERLRRKPYPAQVLCLLGVVKRWQQARTAAVIAECGTGKTLISLGAVHTSAHGRRYTALAMVPPQLVLKWAKESFLTVPGVRVFIIDGLRETASARTDTAASTRSA